MISQTPSPERKGLKKFVWFVIPFVVILTTICVGLPGLYRYAIYDSLCLDVKVNDDYSPYYFLRSMIPDMEAAQVFLKDHLVHRFSQTALEPGYPWVETKIIGYSSPYNNYIDSIHWNLRYMLENQGIILQNWRTTYLIHLNSQGSEVKISYHPPEENWQDPIYFGGDNKIYVLSFWDAYRHIGGPVIVVDTGTYIDPEIYEEQNKQTRQFIESAWDTLKKCHP